MPRRVAVTNETGRFDRSASTMSSLVREGFALRMPYAVWFGSDGCGGAQGLVEEAGALRPNGVAFRTLARRLASP